MVHASCWAIFRCLDGRESSPCLCHPTAHDDRRARMFMTKQVGTTGEPNRWSPTPALEGWLFARNASLFAIVAMVVPRFIGLQAQSGWERYVARPLWRIVQQHKATLASEPGQVVTAVSADQFPSVTSLCFTGGEREFDSETETFVTAYWLRVLRQPPPAKVAHRVFQFADDSMFYWIALQDTLLDSFRAEMKPGASARVWVVWLGALT